MTPLYSDLLEWIRTHRNWWLKRQGDVVADPVPWFRVRPEITMQPGATVTALQPFEGHVDLFVTGTDGAVWSTFHEGRHQDWLPWFPIHHEITMQPGATVTALQPFEGHVDLFVTGTDGAVWSTYYEAGRDWLPWFPIHHEIKMQPGATVTALQPFEGHVDLFVTGTDGAVWSTFHEGRHQDWLPWFPIHHEITMQPGATVTALQPFEGHVDLFVTGTDGAVWSTYYEAGHDWLPWFPIHHEIKMQPGATVTVPTKDLSLIFLTATGTDGTVWSTFFLSDEGRWSMWAPISPQLRMRPGSTAMIPMIAWGSGFFNRPIYGVDTSGAVWSTQYETSDDWWAGPGWERYWTQWAEIIPGTRVVGPCSDVTVIELGVKSEKAFATHTDIFATGPDGTVWSTFWETQPGSRSYFPNIPLVEP